MVQANRTYALLSAVFNFATRSPKWQSLIAENPVTRTLKPLARKICRYLLEYSGFRRLDGVS